MSVTRVILGILMPYPLHRTAGQTECHISPPQYPSRLHGTAPPCCLGSNSSRWQGMNPHAVQELK